MASPALKIPESISFESRAADLAKTKEDIIKQQQPVIERAKAAYDKTITEGAAREKLAGEAYSKAATEASQFADKAAPPSLKQEEYKEKPINDKEMQLTASILGAFALIGSKGSSTAMVGALDSISSAMNAYKQGHEEQAKKDFEQFKTKSAEALRIHQEMKDEYIRILSNKEKGVAQRLQEFNIATRQYEHQQGTAAKTLEEAYKIVNQAEQQYDKGMDALMKFTGGMEQKAAAAAQQKELAIMAADLKMAIANEREAGWHPTGAVDKDNHPILINAKGDVKILDVEAHKVAGGKGGSQSANVQIQSSRIVGAAEQAASDLQNMSDLIKSGATSTSGFKSEGHGLLDGTKNAFVQKMTDEASQEYDVAGTGLSRNLATLEAQGVAQGLVGLSKTIEQTIKAQPNDTVGTRALRLAQSRQIIDNAIINILDREVITPDQRTSLLKFQDIVHKSVPFNTQQVIRVSHSAEDDVSLWDIIQQDKKMTQARKPYDDAEKEKRYQEWKAKQAK